jgi:hypothetical protein
MAFYRSVLGISAPRELNNLFLVIYTQQAAPGQRQ